MPETRRHPHVVNLDEITPDQQDQGSFGFRRRRLGSAAAGRAIGCSYFEVAPGKTAFPFHFHSAFEEVLFLIEGTGTLRLGKDAIAVRAGDYVALPPGPETAHQLTNTGAATLRYLALAGSATPMTLDVVGYPDSKKVGFAAGVDPAKGLRSGWLMKMVKESQPDAGYFDDEPLAQK
jgi:uncharacterized cupin superfamily protein